MENTYTHCFIFNLDELELSIPVATAKQFLEPGDAERLTQVKVRSRMLEIIYGRYITKTLLSQYTKTSSQNIKILYGSHKKPYINLPNIHFNISHTDDFISCCIADSEVGVDIELPKNNLSHDIDAIALRHFTAEESYKIVNTTKEHDKINVFYQLWTCKEAALKAVGLGLYFPPSNIHCEELLKTTGTTINTEAGIFNLAGYYKYNTYAGYHLAIVKCAPFGDLKIFTDKDAFEFILPAINPF